MNKPISLILRELKEDLVASLNKASLHPLLLEYVLNSLCAEVKQLSAQQCANEEQEYLASLESPDHSGHENAFPESLNHSGHENGGEEV